MTKNKIFMDFDGVIFDISQSRDRIYDTFFKAGYSMQDIKTTYMLETMNYNYNPMRHLERLQKIKHTNQKLAEARIENLYQNIPKHLYDDVPDFADSLDRDKYESNILTMGDKEFLNKKIEYSGIADKFDNIYITEDQKWDYLKKLVQPREEFIIIDDRADVLEKVKKEFPKSLCIQIIRQDLGFEDAAMMYKDVYSGIKIKELLQAVKYL